MLFYSLPVRICRACYPSAKKLERFQQIVRAEKLGSLLLICTIGWPMGPQNATSRRRYTKQNVVFGIFQSLKNTVNIVEVQAAADTLRVCVRAPGDGPNIATMGLKRG
jgi:hypothetical protein